MLISGDDFNDLCHVGIFDYNLITKKGDHYTVKLLNVIEDQDEFVLKCMAGAPITTLKDARMALIIQMRNNIRSLLGRGYDNKEIMLFISPNKELDLHTVDLYGETHYIFSTQGGIILFNTPVELED